MVVSEYLQRNKDLSMVTLYAIKQEWKLKTTRSEKALATMRYFHPVKHSYIQILLALVAQYKLKLDQLDVNSMAILKMRFICLSRQGSRLQEKNIWYAS